jgi:hypothetical protein
MHCRRCDLDRKKADYRAHPKKYLDRQRKYAYGITAHEYDSLHAAQGGVCAICGLPETRRTKSSLAVDHCHTTGKIRGLLCSMCNPGLGGFKDNPELLLAAVAYLKKHSG